MASRKAGAPWARKASQAFNARNGREYSSVMSTAWSSWRWCGRYPSSWANAAARSSGRRTSTTPQAFGRYSHLCTSTEHESARSSPVNRSRPDRVAAAGSPYAPSMCSHTPRSAHTSASASAGSTAPVRVVPPVATTATGVTPSIDRDRMEGVTPVAVVATGGTTLTGAVDPADALADVCAERGVWLHIDGAYGLPAAATRSGRDLFTGLERADSCSVDVHKWLYLPKACGVVLVRRPDDLAAAFAHEEGYLPHQRHELHAVDITLEYSRPFRALKAWLAFRAHGAPAFREAIERNLHEARLLYEAVKAQPDFEVLGPPPQLSIVPFRHTPRGAADPNDHNARLAQAMLADGRVYLASALIDDEVYLRPCFVNFRTTEEDVLALIDVARELGDRLAAGG